MDNEEDPYICIGVCMADPDSGYCVGCGRPPLPSPESEAPATAPAVPAQPESTDTPE